MIDGEHQYSSGANGQGCYPPVGRTVDKADITGKSFVFGYYHTKNTKNKPVVSFRAPQNMPFKM